MELNFDDIVSGKDPKAEEEAKKAQETVLKSTETRQRQQSCMISEIDKDLVTTILTQLPSGAKPKLENFRVSLSDMLCLVK